MKTNDLEIKYVNPSTLRPSLRNVKKHSKGQIQKTSEIISQLGFNEPILAKPDGEIISGHCRWEAAKLLELESIPVMYADLGDVKARLQALASNRLGELGKTDEQLLKIELEELELACADIDIEIELSGYDSVKLDLIQEQKEEDPKLNSAPLIEENDVVSVMGDLWLFPNDHRLYHGDSLKEESFQILFGDKKANLCVQDPPFNVKVQGHVCGAGETKHKEFAFASGEMNDGEFVDFLTSNFRLCAKYSTDGSLHLNFMDWRHGWHILSAGRAVFSGYVNKCIWDKIVPGTGSLWRSQYEEIHVFKNGKESHVNNVLLGSTGRVRSNVWSCYGVNVFGKNKAALKMHPTSKPEKLLRSAILDVSNRGDIVLDSFAGSGSCLIACEKAKRVFYGIEYEGLYVDTIIRRYQQCFGGDVIHAASGRKYDELLAEHRAKREG
ncbi:MAG: ParB N-terminal domain-containing protein [Rickettsiales bacterium]|jgi:DNA modification methylase|nr:ParB N-terminal domain-containing protein [Rickettsiales bacterium]